MEKKSIRNLEALEAITILGKKSWVAYVFPVCLGLLLFFIFLDSFKVLCIVPTIGMVYAFFQLRSYTLYMDDKGVWIQSGFLPWTKGSRGVKWRDLDDAEYFTGLVSWVTRSYRVLLKHRYTKNSEIYFSHMSNGHQAVMAINEKHDQLLN